MRCRIIRRNVPAQRFIRLRFDSHLFRSLSQQRIFLLPGNACHMQSSLGQTLVDDRQLMLAGLVHQHIHVAVLQYTRLVRLTNGPHETAAIVLPSIIHTQQQVIAHMVVLEFVGGKHFG